MSAGTFMVDDFVLRYLALESMCLLAASEFSHDAVKKHQDTVITALKVSQVTTALKVGLVITALKVKSYCHNIRDILNYFCWKFITFTLKA